MPAVTTLMRYLLLLLCLLAAPVSAQQPPGQDLDRLYAEGSHFQTLGRFKDALSAYQQALSLAIRSWGATDEKVLLPLEKIFDVHMAMQSWSAAESDRRQALQIVLFNHEKNDPALAHERVRLARFLAERQRYPEAEGVYRDAITGISESPIAANDEGPSLMDELSHVLEIEKKNAEALMWRARAEQIRKNRYQ